MSVDSCSNFTGSSLPEAPILGSEVGFRMRAGARLIVEARDAATAASVFELVDRRDRQLDGKTAKLAPNLFFAQAEKSGAYWVFVKRE